MTTQHHLVAAMHPPAGALPGRAHPAHGGRAGPLAGLFGLACFGAGSLIAGLPQPDAPDGAVIARLAAGRTSVLAGMLLMFLALPFLLGFLGYFVGLLARAEGPPRLFAWWTAGAWLMLFAIVAAGMLPLAAVAWSGVAETAPAMVRLAFDVNNLSLYALSAPVAAASVLAPSQVIRRTRILPRWLIWLGLVEVAINAIELGGLLAHEGSDAAGYALAAGPMVWIIWIGAISVAALAGADASGSRTPDRQREPESADQGRTAS